MLLGGYGDSRALSLLYRALDEVPLSEDRDDNRVFIEIEAAIAELGGSFTPVQREKLAGVDASFGKPARSRAKVGRNDPCPCGSAKKYKKCHGAPGADPL